MNLELTVDPCDEGIIKNVLETMFNTKSKGYILAVQTEKGTFITLKSKGSEDLAERIVKDYLMELDLEKGENNTDDLINKWREECYE